MAVFCSYLISCFSDMLLRYFVNDLEMVPVAPVVTGITFVFTFHMRCISVVRSLLLLLLLLLFEEFTVKCFCVCDVPLCSASVSEVRTPPDTTKHIVTPVLSVYIVMFCI